MFRYTSRDGRLGATGRRHGGARRRSRRARACAPARSLAPVAAPSCPPRRSASPLRRRPAGAGAQRARARSRASTTAPRCSPRSTTLARADLDAVNIRLQEARRDLDARAGRARRRPGACAASGSPPCTRATATACSTCSSTSSDFGEADTQLGYFRSIDEADQETVSRIAAMERQVAAAHEADRRGPRRRARQRDRPARAAGRHRGRARRARAAARRPRRARQEAPRAAGELDAAASRRLARAAGVDLATIHGHAGADRRASRRR